MLTLTRKELETKKKLELLEEISVSDLTRFTNNVKSDIQKGVFTEEEITEFVNAEVNSFDPIMVVEDNLVKRTVLIRPIQVKWDEKTISKSIEERDGFYLATKRNNSLGIVGMPYDFDIIKGKRAVIGEIRYYGGVPYRKVSATGKANKDWQVVKDMAKKPGAKGGEKHEEKVTADKPEEKVTADKPEDTGKTMSPKDIVAILKNKEDWGDLGDYVSVVDGKLQVVDSFYYGGIKRLESLKKEWTEEGGSYAKYFKEEYGIKFKLTESDVQTFATGKYKKLFGSNMGMALIKLEVENIQ